MSTQDLHAGWVVEEGEQHVPVRSESGASKNRGADSIVIGGPGHDIQRVQERNPSAPRNDSPNPAMLRLSAILGIGIVIVGAGLYFGFIGTLQGDITNGIGSTTIVITKDGHFSPSNVTVKRGGTLTIKNENQNPQVMKPKDGRELFPVQVIFETPYTTTISTTSEGTYTYISETLPESEVLQIVVAPDTTIETPANVVASREVVDIPLPFGEEVPAKKVVPEAESAMATGNLPAPQTTEIPVTIQTEHQNDSAVVSIVTAGKTANDIPVFESSKIPVNPYTVEEGKKKSQQVEIATGHKAKEAMHAGAPLQKLKKYKPVHITDTGPAGSWLLFFPAVLGLFFLYQRSLRSIGL